MRPPKLWGVDFYPDRTFSKSVVRLPDPVIAKLAVGDAMVSAGTHLLDRADFEFKEADFKDPRQ